MIYKCDLPIGLYRNKEVRLFIPNRLIIFFYFYRCTVQFEDSSIITHQQMHQYYLLFKIGFNP
jgi:hypothetical protein